MSNIAIKRGQSTISNANPLSSSNMSKAVMGDEQITLVWETPAFVQLHLGDYIVFEGADWTLNQLPTVKKLSAKLFQYNAVFQSSKYDLIKAMYLLFDNTDTIPSGEFSLTGNADAFMGLLIQNLNRVFGQGTWIMGTVLTGTDTKTLTFSNESCMSVLEKLASEFMTEYSVINNTVHLTTVSTVRNVMLEYGSTLYDIERSSVNSSDIVTRLYPFGSEKNLAATYRGGSGRLLLPSPDTYIDHANKVLYGIIEQSKTFDEVYPRLSSGPAGTVTSVGNILVFTDSHLDFNVNSYLLDGTTAKIHFNSGACAGYDFEISFFDNTTKTFTIVPNTSEKDFTLPNVTLYPAIGDTYVLLDIVMPPSYVTAAEAELRGKAIDYLNENSFPKVSYKVTFSSIYAIQNLQNVECGDTVLVHDIDLEVNENIRIQKITKGLTDFWTMQIDLSNTVTKTTLQRISGDIGNVTNQVIVTNEAVKRNYTRSYQNNQELKQMVFDTEGYFNPENIKPLSIETSMLSVGSRSQSFQITTVFNPNYIGNPQVLNWTAGVLDHFTIDETSVKEWVISAGSITIATPYQNVAMYIYARCSRIGTTGDIYLSTTAIKFDSDATNWFFLLGVLHSPVGGVRGISLTYGQTTIDGQFIKTGNIQSIDGFTYFNLSTGEIGGNIKFKSTSGTLIDIQSGINQAQIDAQDYADQQAESAQQAAKEYVDSQNVILNQSINDLQTQQDGEISNWSSNSQSEAPNLTNYPASQWTSDTIRDRHILDVYTNFQNYVDETTTPNAGKSWKFGKLNGVYSWSLIADNNQSKAYLLATKAQTTANRKITTYNSIPNVVHSDDGLCYRKGDMWILATTWNGYKIGEILCASQDSASFVSSDWTKWVNYTDDTAVNNLKIGGRNLFINSNSIDPISVVSTSAFAFFSLDSYFVNLTEGVAYAISFDAKVNSGDGVLHSEFWGGNGFDITISTNSYQRYSAIIKFNAHAHPLLHFWLKNTAGSINLKNIKIESGTKSTDWTPAPEDVQKQIDNIVSDGILSSGSEKNSQLQAWNAIVAEYASLLAQGNTYSSSKVASYTSAYTALGTYLNGGSNWTIGTVPVWIGSQLTQDTTIVAATYNSKWNDYYTAATALKNDLYALSANKAVGDLQIGGRNLVLNSGTARTSTFTTYNDLLSQALIIGKTYIFSFGSLSVNSTTLHFYLRINSTGYSETFNIQPNVPFVPNKAYDTIVIVNENQQFSYTISNVKLEIGNKATDYTQAPEDIQASISSAQTAANTAIDNLNNLKISSRNLIPNSNINVDSLVYGFATRQINLKAGTKYMFSANGNNKNATEGRYLCVFIYNDSWSNAQSLTIVSTDDKTVFSPFTAASTGIFTCSAYYMDNKPIPTGSVRLNWMALVEGDKPMISWTPAPEDVQAGIDANTASLTDMASDNKLTPLEKQQVKIMLDAIEAEYINLDNQAQNIIGAVDAYEDAYNYVHDNITPLISDLTTTSLISGETLRWYFSNYYTQRSIVQSQIQSAIDSTANSTNYLKNALQGSTEVTGGLVGTNVILMKDTDGTVTAGINGLSTSSDDLRFWSGATFENRLSASFQVFKSGLIKAFSGFIGNFKIVSGSLIGYIGGAEKIVFSTDTLPAITQLSAGGNVSIVDGNKTTTGTVSPLGHVTNYYDVDIIIPYTTQVGFIPAQISLLLAGQGVDLSDANVVQHLKVTKNSVGVYDADFDYNQSGVTLSLASGTYHVTVSSSFDNPYITATTYEFWAGIGSIIYTEVVAKTKFGANGLFSFFGTNKHFYFTDEYGLHSRGATDIPAGLGGASISSGGIVSSPWGKITAIGNVVKSGSNYTITHNIGDTNYSLILTPISTNVAYFSSKSPNTIVVTCAGGFDFILIRTQ